MTAVTYRPLNLSARKLQVAAARVRAAARSHLAGFAPNRSWLRATIETHTPGLVAHLDASLARARTDWPLLAALLRRRLEKRDALFREAERADAALTTAMTALAADLNALQRGGAALINVAASNLAAVLAQRNQPFAPHITWAVPNLTAAERWRLNQVIETHRKANERFAHLFHGTDRTKALLYLGSKQSPMAVQDPVDWWRSVPPAEQAALLTRSSQLFI